MSQAPVIESDDLVGETPTAEPLGLAADPVEIRRNAGLAVLVGAVASAVAIGYLARATGTGSWLDWTLFALMGVVGVAHLLAFVDARTPLLVADGQGVRIRLGHTWRGIPWGALAQVEHLPRRGVLRDGRLVLVARNPERVLDELDRSGRRQSRLATRLYGAPFAVPLALSTRVLGADGDLTGALSRLSGDAARIVELDLTAPVEPAVEGDEPDGTEHVDEVWDEGLEDVSARRWHDPRPALAVGISVLSRLQRRRESAADTTDDDAAAEPAAAVAPDEKPEHERSDSAPMVASATPSPLREPITAARSEITRELTLGAVALAPDRGDDANDASSRLPEARELRRPGSVNLVEDTLVWGDRVRPISRPGASIDPLVIDEFAVEPAPDPVIGPEFAAARTRLGLTVDQLADRTRIRPHVIESIEVDDFAPCGGDFYARGHLRTLGRVLGVEVAPLLVAYDDRYSDAPINPRRVFEAELATGSHGSIRGTRGGPNWSMLIAVVMTLVLAWSVARLVMDSPVELRQQAPILNGSGGTDNSIQLLGEPVPVVLTAAGGGARLVVRDGAGQVIFSGDLAFGESKTLPRVAPPVRIQSTDGSVVVNVDGEDRGALGATGQTAQNTFPVR